MGKRKHSKPGSGESGNPKSAPDVRAGDSRDATALPAPSGWADALRLCREAGCTGREIALALVLPDVGEILSGR